MAALLRVMNSCSNVEESIDNSDEVAVSIVIYGNDGGNEIILNVGELLPRLHGVTLQRTEDLFSFKSQGLYVGLLAIISH